MWCNLSVGEDPTSAYGIRMMRAWRALPGTCSRVRWEGVVFERRRWDACDVRIPPYDDVGAHIQQQYDICHGPFPPPLSNDTLDVVIPVYNGAPYLNGSIRRLMRVRGCHVLLVVSRRSTDMSVAYASAFANPRVEVIVSDETRAGALRNIGLRRTRARLTAFFDVDDDINVDAVSRNVHRLLEAKCVDALIAPYRRRRGARSLGMLSSDIMTWRRIAHAYSRMERRLRAMQLHNFAWTQITRTALLHRRMIAFGHTVTFNDLLFHKRAVATSRDIAFGDWSMVVWRHRRGQRHLSGSLTWSDRHIAMRDWRLVSEYLSDSSQKKREEGYKHTNYKCQDVATTTSKEPFEDAIPANA